MFYGVSVDTHAPREPRRYASFVQDGISIYYSPTLARKSDTLELDYVRMLFQSRAIISGPEELIAQMIMGRM